MVEAALETRVFPHAMLREIYEQPEAIEATLRNYLVDGSLNPEAFKSLAEALRGHERIVIAASGSSRHAGLAAEIMLEDLAGLTVDVEYASEYCYRSTHTLQNPGVIVVSQSGETADTLAALREAKARGLATVAITNHAGSSMAKEADASLPTYAGKEKAIPATKSFTTQLVVLYLTTLYLARLRGRMTSHAVAGFCEQLNDVVADIRAALPGWEESAREFAEAMKGASAVLYLGRAIHYAIAREGALKLKESAYVQAEGYPAGELKHGPNALVSKNAPLVVIATRDRSDPDSVLRYEKTAATAARHARPGCGDIRDDLRGRRRNPPAYAARDSYPRGERISAAHPRGRAAAIDRLLQRHSAGHRRGQSAQPGQSGGPGIVAVSCPPGG